MNTGMPRNVFIMKSSQRIEHSAGCLSPGLVHVQQHKTRSCVSDYGLLGIGQGLLRMKSGCQDTSGTEPLVAVSFSLAERVSLLLVFFLQESCQYCLRSMGL